MRRLSKMKLFLVVAFVGVAFVAADNGGYLTGPYQNLMFEWKTGTNIIRGNYIEASLEGYGNDKRVFARMGAEGSWSDWIDSNELRAEVTDYGNFFEGDYEATPYWK